MLALILEKIAQMVNNQNSEIDNINPDAIWRKLPPNVKKELILYLIKKKDNSIGSVLNTTAETFKSVTPVLINKIVNEMF